MKICIIGGGTAGWLTALCITKISKFKHYITVIESSKIKIIGAGEGTTGVFGKILENLEIDEAEFMIKTHASQKMGINFVNWRGEKESYIAPIDNTYTSEKIFDHFLMKSYADNNFTDFHRSTLCGILAEHNLSSIDFSKKIHYAFNAYHFDGHLVGQYLKSLCIDQCNLIDAEYSHCKKDERGFIKSITLSNGQEVVADYFVDCTGFARILSKELGTRWHSYKENLSCNTAVPFLLPHGNDIIRPLTTSQALNNGWMWKIPTQDRYGCGYVFDDNFISPDQAVEEVEKLLQQPVNPIKVIKFEPGRLEKTFDKNVISIGLSGIFLEPLQATSIHGSITQIQYLIHQYLNTNIPIQDDSQNNLTNKIINNMADNFADLIQVHYKSGRSDTEFWKRQQLLPEREFVSIIKNIGNRRHINKTDFDHIAVGAGYPVFIYPVLFNQWINKDNIIEQLKMQNFDQEYYSYNNWIFEVKRNVISHNEMIADFKSNNIRNLQRRLGPIMRSSTSLPIHPLLAGKIS